jgi:hypothetical protein
LQRLFFLGNIKTINSCSIAEGIAFGAASTLYASRKTPT